MIALVQRVSSARVEVEDVGETGSIGNGLCVFLCVVVGDVGDDADWLADKIARLRIFSDDQGRFNHSLGDIGGEVLLVSQFTLAADATKGNRPSFIRAARPEEAVPLLQRFSGRLREEHGITVEEGHFGASMSVELANDGPVTLQLDTQSR
ncbi:MAG: D-tyrosyl-tRNA(Tyr) deacylase [Phycisphaerae bacterium]|nr:D-tyrosyl-tRNA(Tyr) deacylase [Phycisphaerae bacterium]HAW95617.1 D-tyrosyl-tRNA(Tyr) deacylase [Phycisphaerales bacterium]